MQINQKKQIVAASFIMAILVFIPTWTIIPAFAVETEETYEASTLRGGALLLQDGDIERFDASIQVTAVVTEVYEEYLEFKISIGHIKIGNQQFTIVSDEFSGFASLNGGRFRLISEAEDEDCKIFQLVLCGHQIRRVEDGVVMKVSGMLWSGDAVYLLHFIILRTHVSPQS